MRYRSSKSSLTLIEISLSILIFAVCSAVCLKIFAYASNMSRESRELSDAVILAETAAECWKAGGESPEKAADLLGGSLEDGVISAKSGELEVIISFENEMADINVVTSDGGNIYSLCAVCTGGTP